MEQLKPTKQGKLSIHHCSIIRKRQENEVSFVSDDDKGLQELMQEMLTIDRSHIFHWMERLTFYLRRNNRSEISRYRNGSIISANTEKNSFYCDIMKCWKTIHGFLILHLGNSTSKDRFPIILIQCLREVYHETLPLTIFPAEELEQVVSLLSLRIPQQKRKYQEDHQKPSLPLSDDYDENDFDHDNKTLDGEDYMEWMICCLDILQMILIKNEREQHKKRVEVIHPSKTFYAFLVHLATKNGETSELMIKAQKLLAELKDSQNYYEGDIHPVSTAMLALDSIHANTPNLVEVTSKIQHEKDLLMFYQCLANSHQGATLILQNASSVCHHLGNIILKDDKKDMEDRIIATECLVRMTAAASSQQRESRKTNTRLTKSAIVVMETLLDVERGGEETILQEIAVLGLEHSIVQQELLAWNDSRFTYLFESMFGIAVRKEKKQCKARISAANIILHGFLADDSSSSSSTLSSTACRDCTSDSNKLQQQGSMHDHPQEGQQLQQQQHCDHCCCPKHPWSLLLVGLLQNDLDEIVQRTVNAIHKQQLNTTSTTNNVRVNFLIRFPNVLAELANVAVTSAQCHKVHSSFDDECFLERQHQQKLKQQQRQILEIFCRLSEQNDLFLARQEKALQAIVSIASLSLPPNSNQNNQQQLQQQHKRLAMTILIRLASNVCNRRILAKQVGVLSCMIRFIRTMSDIDEETTIQRVDLKQHILQLAHVL